MTRGRSGFLAVTFVPAVPRATVTTNRAFFMSAIPAIFSFKSNQIRSILINGQPWFVASDICSALSISNAAGAVQRLDDDEKGLHTIDTLGGHQEKTVINESGLYSLILTSRKKEAKIFKKWITSEVIPSIRNTGSYSSATAISLPNNFIEALELLIVKEKQLIDQAPMVEVYKLLADRKGDVSTTIIAKELGTTAIKLNKFLRDKGMKWLNADLPKAGYEKYFNVVADVKNGHEFTQCLITPDGQIEIAKLWGEK